MKREDGFAAQGRNKAQTRRAWALYTRLLYVAKIQCLCSRCSSHSSTGDINSPNHARVLLQGPSCGTDHARVLQPSTGHVRLLHVCSSLSLSSASVMAVPRNHLNLNLVFRRFPHLLLPPVQPVKLLCSPRLHGLLRLSVQHLRHDQPPDEKQRYRLCERLGRSLGKRWTVYCR